MRARDLKPVHAIELACYTNGLSYRNIRSIWRNPSVDSLVVTSYGQVIAYMMVGYCGEYGAEILNLAVDPMRRREGAGTLLLDRLKDSLIKWGRPASGLVMERNVGAQLFCRANQFRAVEIERVPVAGSDEDGYRFAWCHDWTPSVGSSFSSRSLLDFP